MKKQHYGLLVFMFSFMYRIRQYERSFVNFISARNSVMHLSFDILPVKLGDNTVQDQSGNKNDAGLANGAEISNRTMGKGTQPCI